MNKMIFDILTIAIFSVWLTSWFKPLEFFRYHITDAWTRACIKAGFPALQRLVIVISCPKCFGFWFTLFYKQDFWLALAVSFVAYLLKFIIDRIELWYEKS